MICEQCYLRLGCHRTIAPDGRCHFYVKKTAIKLDENSVVDPMATVEFVYSDLKHLLGASSKDRKAVRKKTSPPAR